jgi:hypothetical protein
MKTSRTPSGRRINFNTLQANSNFPRRWRWEADSHVADESDFDPEKEDSHKTSTDEELIIALKRVENNPNCVMHWKWESASRLANDRELHSEKHDSHKTSKDNEAIILILIWFKPFFENAISQCIEGENQIQIWLTKMRGIRKNMICAKRQLMMAE